MAKPVEYQPDRSTTELTLGERYQTHLESEIRSYNDCLKVHELPQIFHYWSNRYLRPKLEVFGFSSPEDMFRKYLEESCARHRGHATHFVSIGSGNCDLELDVALHLRSKGYVDFVIDCLDVNASMLERGRAAAAKADLSNQIRCLQMDFNQWDPSEDYDAVIANQTLHHVVNLEGLFAQIKQHLKPDGDFVISDMIGRNGHRRWPEALAIVHEYWRKLPPSYRYNRDHHRYEELFADWDCSAEGGFEGVRSQDILPLLLSHFNFRLFVGFSNIIDPFLDRSFGHNFNATAEWDRAFIDAVHHRDEAEIHAGRIKPTHMLAVVGNDPSGPVTCHAHLSPEFCLRPPDTAEEISDSEDATTPAYHWREWPHSSQAELEIACERLKDAAQRIIKLKKVVQERTDWAFQRDKEFLERTYWALQLDKELTETTGLVHQLREELDAEKVRVAALTDELKRTEWLRRVYQEVLGFYHRMRH